MSNDNTSGYGTEVAACVTMQPNGEHTLASVEWQCDFWTTGRRFRVTKDKAFQDGENSYICYVDSTKTGRGALWGQLFVRIPDSQAADGFREEVSTPFPIMSADGSDKQLYIV